MDEIKVTPRFHKIGSSKNNLLVVVKDDIIGKKFRHAKMYQNLKE